MSGRYSTLIKLATTFSLGYGAFLGVAANARQPQNLTDAEEQARASTLGKNIAKDIGIGFADDAVGIGLGMAAARFVPGLRGIIGPSMGFLAAAGAGVASATGMHDIMNFFAARRYVSEHRSKNDGKIGDYRYAAIDGFLKGGAGNNMRSAMTGINSPASQAVYNQITRNPYANLLTSLIPKSQRAGTDPGSGESPAYNPIRSGLIAAHGVGIAAEALTASRLGFGPASLVGSLVGGAAGIATISGIGNPQGASKAEAYRALLGTYAPLFGTFSAIEGLRALRNSRFKGLAAVGMGVEKLIAKGSAASYHFGRNVAPKYIAKSEGYLGSLSGRYENWLKSSGIVADKFSSVAAAAQGMHANKASYPGFMQGMIDRFHNIMFNANDPMHSLNDRTLSKVLHAGPNTLSGIHKYVGGAVFGIARQSAETFEHTGAPHGSQWAQSFAIAHLITDVPHLYETAHSVISGHNHTVFHKRKKHHTTSMPSNQA